MGSHFIAARIPLDITLEAALGRLAALDNKEAARLLIREDVIEEGDDDWTEGNEDGPYLNTQGREQLVADLGVAYDDSGRYVRHYDFDGRTWAVAGCLSGGDATEEMDSIWRIAALELTYDWWDRSVIDSKKPRRILPPIWWEEIPDGCMFSHFDETEQLIVMIAPDGQSICIEAD